jgi:thiol-disulfide isomerase/thioredoxin
MILRFLILAGVSGLALSAPGQQTRFIPETGKHYPNPAIVYIQHEKATEAISLASWKGIPLIVDFFSSHCIVCFKSMPKVNRLQEQFNGRLRFLLVGKEDEDVRKVYEKFRQQLNLHLDVAYDSVLQKDLKEYSYPLYVWIDASGIVQAITGVEEVTTENVESFITQNSFVTNPSQQMIPFDPTKPFLVNGNGGNDSVFLSRSLFSELNPITPLYLPPAINYDKLGNSLQLLGVTLSDLYQYAYFGVSNWDPSNPLYGSTFPFPIMDDGTILSPDRKPALYCYSLYLSPRQNKYLDIQKRFQADLENQFDLSATIEYRLMPYYKIVIRPGFENKLLAKSGKTVSKVTHAGFDLQNVPIQRLVQMMAARFQRAFPFIDESAFHAPINISCEVLMTDFESVKKALFEKGIEIQAAVKPMRVIILR